MKSPAYYLYSAIAVYSLALCLCVSTFANPGHEFKTIDFINGDANREPLSNVEQIAYRKFKSDATKTGHLGAMHKAGAQLLEGSDLLGADTMTIRPTSSQKEAISKFENSFAKGQTKEALKQIQGFSISQLHLFAGSKFDHQLGICLLDNGAYGQAVEFLGRYAYYNSDSIQGWRAMRLASKLAGKTNNIPDLELGFAKNEGVHFELVH